METPLTETVCERLEFITKLLNSVAQELMVHPFVRSWQKQVERAGKEPALPSHQTCAKCGKPLAEPAKEGERKLCAKCSNEQ